MRLRLIPKPFWVILASMAQSIEEIQAQALRLPPAAREELAGALLQSLEDEPLNEIDKAWIAEAEERYEAWQVGDTKPIAGERFFPDLRRELGCG